MRTGDGAPSVPAGAIPGEAASGGGGRFDEPPPRWPWISGLLLCLLGFGVAGYLTYEHYTGSSSLTCPAGSAHGGAIDCLKVTTSVYSVKYGVPVAVLGLIYFAAMALLQTPMAWHSRRPVVRAARITWCLIGIATAFQLVYDELYRIDAICLWCTAVHIVTFLVLVTTVLGTLSTSELRTATAE